MNDVENINANIDTLNSVVAGLKDVNTKLVKDVADVLTLLESFPGSGVPADQVAAIALKLQTSVSEAQTSLADLTTTESSADAVTP